MLDPGLVTQAAAYVDALCLPFPDRHVGGPGNAHAVELFESEIAGLGFELTRTEIPSVVWEPESAQLEAGGRSSRVLPGPYSTAIRADAPLVVVETLDELEACEARGAVLLVRGDLVKEQLTPKNYPFYRFERHAKIVEALEKPQPLAVVAATGRSSELVGSLYPFPLIEDADFDLPHAFMTDVDGAALAEFAGQSCRLEIRSGRRLATAHQLEALRGPADRRVVVSAHIDSRRGTPGAIDNATGVTILLLVARLLAGHEPAMGIELVPFNGEDDYAAPGEVSYLARKGDRLADEVVLEINVDGVGWRDHDTEVSLYECPAEVADVVRGALGGRVVEGEQWPQSDHMVFVMRGIPAVALTTADASALRMTIAHTEADTPVEVDPTVVAETAVYLADVIRTLTTA